MSYSQGRGPRPRGYQANRRCRNSETISRFHRSTASYIMQRNGVELRVINELDSDSLTSKYNGNGNGLAEPSKGLGTLAASQPSSHYKHILYPLAFICVPSCSPICLKTFFSLSLSLPLPLSLSHALRGQARDFTGAVTLLEFNRRSGEDDALEDTLMWLGYCAFHVGNYQRAIDAYHVGGRALRG